MEFEDAKAVVTGGAGFTGSRWVVLLAAGLLCAGCVRTPRGGGEGAGGEPPRGRVLVARVLDRATQTPIEGALVEVDDRRIRDGFVGIGSARTNGCGVAIVRGLPEGRLAAWARADGWVHEGMASTIPGSVEGVRSMEITLELQRGAQIGGRLRFADGSSTSGIVVTVWRRRHGGRFTSSLVLGPGGAFRFDDVPNEPLTLKIWVESTRADLGHVDAVAGVDDMQIVLPSRSMSAAASR